MATKPKVPHAGVEERWTKADGTPTVNHGKGMRWRARYVDDEGRERAKGFTRKTDAQKWLDVEVTAAFATGSYVDPERGQVTFASYWREWSSRQVWESSTHHVMAQAARSVTFGDVALGDLRPSHLEAWVKAMQDDGLQPSTIRTRFSNARTAIRAAVQDRFMARDITQAVRLPRQRKLAAAMTIPEAADVGAIMRAADEAEPWFTAFVAVCAFAGLRRGEACALRMSDIGFLQKELHVRRQVQWTDDGRMEIRGPKYGSERTVFIPEQLVTIVSEHVRVHRPGDDPERWLFAGYLDPSAPLHAARAGRAWRSVRGDVDVQLHDLRPFFASGLIAAGCDVVTVQRALGDTSAAETLRTYSHLWPDASDRTRKDAGALVDLALSSTADGSREKPLLTRHLSSCRGSRRAPAAGA